MADQTSEASAVAVSTENPETKSGAVPVESSPITATPTPTPQPITPLENEPTPAGNHPSENGLGEKLRRATAGLFAKAGFKKGKGRPKKCRECGGDGCDECNWTGKEPGRADVPISQGDGGELDLETAPEAAGIKIPVSGVDSPGVATARGELFRRSVTAAARSALKILTAVVRVYMDAAELDAKFCDRAISKCEPSGDALNRWSESLDAVLKKHNVEPKHSEEIALAVNTAELLVPFGVLIAELKGEIRRRKLEGK